MATPQAPTAGPPGALSGPSAATLDVMLGNLSDASPTGNGSELAMPPLGAHSLVLAVALYCFCIFVILGNVLVIVAVVRDRVLHSVTNYFIMSLAVSDTIVGAFVMTFGASLVATDGFWMFGPVWCDLWHSFDVLGSTASILNLCVISLDRYWAIRDPFTYPNKMTERTACALIALVWVCSSLISFPAIAWWRAVSSPSPEGTCVFTDNIGYLAFSSVISFYGPLAMMLIVYFRIYRAATEQMRCLKLGSKQVSVNGSGHGLTTLRMHRGGGSGRLDQTCVENDDDSAALGSSDGGFGSSRANLSAKNVKNFSFSRKLAKFAKERKAAKTLGIVMGVFIGCWLPFFIVNLLSGVCYDCIAQPDLVLAIVTWLGWINSAMNPVIYACWSKDFRR